MGNRVFLNNFTRPQAIQVGGTSLLIVIGVAIETMKTLEAQLNQREYRGFTCSGKNNVKVLGNMKNAIAKITGITPAALTFKGKYVAFADNPAPEPCC